MSGDPSLLTPTFRILCLCPGWAEWESSSASPPHSVPSSWGLMQALSQGPAQLPALPLKRWASSILKGFKNYCFPFILPGAESKTPPERPTFGDVYHVKGTAGGSGTQPCWEHGQPSPPASVSLHTPSVVPLSPGAVTPVKDQAVCGSCWSFATTGAMEGALFLKTGVLTPLSQQVLIDCSWGFGNYACDGGEEWRAYEWIKKHGGIASTESYGPYLGQVRNGYCHYNQSELVAPLAGYVTVEPGNAEALKAALFKHGPIAVNIDASHKSFTFYANGVYEEPHCGEGVGLDHAVLAVGYGVLHGKSYWLIKNSWSTYWGNDGYILMAMKDNNCGVATAASFPILA
uniref:Peptidase C1A papain C-terminal domain-containing protein n=1 Tax=Coturnix japonica TaxID=93934 RepID=A0A8C2TWD7_COTJA